ncbi:MAG: hypothetical protein L6R40_007222 [Gallowayella cf. fulva]|nr:MAG: hypothetical protein L6R40_007222 [Xanthomendoza cf. fulva]
MRTLTTLCFLLGLTITTTRSYFVAPPPPSKHGTLSFAPNGNITRVTVNNPPLNLFDNNLLQDMLSFLQSLIPSTRTTPAPKVVIFASANPHFYLMHRDVQGIHPPLLPWKRQAIATYIAITRYLQDLTETVFIGECNGRAFGAGNEVLVQMDMRFAGPNASVGFFENGFGVFPGGGGQQFLAQLTNKARAMEYVLGARQIDGPTGAAIGWFNRYYDSAEALREGVDELAVRIGRFPQGNLNATKAGLRWINPRMEVLEGDVAEFIVQDMKDDTPGLIDRFLELSRNETVTPIELDTPEKMVELYG